MTASRSKDYRNICFTRRINRYYKGNEILTFHFFQEKLFVDSQERRRNTQLAINDVQVKLKSIRSELERTARGDDKYLALVTEEHSIIKEEFSLASQLENVERLEKEKEELRIQLEKENAELKTQLEDSRNGLKNQIDGNHFSSTNRINDLAEKLAKMLKDLNKNNDDILTKLFNEGKLLRNLMGQPLSVFFCANRSEDYETGGEEYLTFDSK